jgi:hypothetical protein
MKFYIFIFSFLFLLSCKESGKNKASHFSVGVDSIEYNPIIYKLYSEPIDTIEFVAFWKIFRQAILKKDMQTLLTMVNDSIETDWNGTGRMSKSEFIDHLYELLTDPYLLCLKEYNVTKDLFSNPENEYRYCKVIETKIYQASLSFSHTGFVNDKRYERTVNYSTGYCIIDDKPNTGKYVIKEDKEFIFVSNDKIEIFNKLYNFGFVKKSNVIKLHYIYVIYNLTVTE